MGEFSKVIRVQGLGGHLLQRLCADHEEVSSAECKAGCVDDITGHCKQTDDCITGVEFTEDDRVWGYNDVTRHHTQTLDCIMVI